MNETNSKVHCGVCDCMVVGDGHALRCRPKVEKGTWSEKRRVAWFGDTVHRMDVQIAMRCMGILPARWEIVAQTYTSNTAQAAYMRTIVADIGVASPHSLGTEFEAQYYGDFRLVYLRSTFPAYHAVIAGAWQPPAIAGGGGSYVMADIK